MSNTVTIKGRRATTSLRVGEVVTVERTEHIDALISRGYAVVVEAADAPETPASLTGAVTPPEPDADAGDGKRGAEAPPRSASRADWVEFLAAQGVEVSDEYRRDDLVELWHG